MNELLKAIILEAEFTELYGSDGRNEFLRRIHLDNLAVDGAKARLRVYTSRAREES